MSYFFQVGDVSNSFKDGFISKLQTGLLVSKCIKAGNVLGLEKSQGRRCLGAGIDWELTNNSEKHIV